MDERSIRFMERAAIHSKHCAYQWLLYLRKVIHRDKVLLSCDEIDRLMQSNVLDSYQRIMLKLAVDKETPIHEFVVSLNEKASDRRFDRIKTIVEKINNERNESSI